ncbi:peptidoglycan-binding protein [Chryseobacterium taeanense]|uniref:peptidoglycan-binding domain-containing protein n=1 Tax=Chryseobacterium taeanense TaxID=311334 RepID=UPI0035AE0BC3
MSRHKKTFAPRANRSGSQNTHHKEEEETDIITSQDVTISLAKTEVSQITYDLFRNRAFKKVENGSATIKFLDKGPHVLILHKALNTLGYKAVGNGSSFWKETKTALINFQQKNNITVTGIFNRETLLKMDEVLEKSKDEKPKDDIVLSAATEEPKTNNSIDDDSVIYPIVVAKNQKFNGKLIQTDEDLNHFAEQQMKLTRHLKWEPKFTDEKVKDIVAKGGSVNYRISAKEHTIEKETEALSPNKKQFIRNPASTADYIQNTRILDLLKQLSEEEIADYKSKVSQETNDLTAIEESLKAYIKNKNLRDKEKNNREQLKEKLGVPGIEDLYRLYTGYIKFKRSHESTLYEPKDPNKVYFQNALDKQLEKLLILLKAHGFTILSFEKLIKNYELAFRKETVHIAEDSLIRYKHILFEQKKKLLNEDFIINLLDKIKASHAKESYEVANNASTPILIEKPSYEERVFKNKMEAIARSKKEEGNAAIKRLSSVTPLVEDNGFNKEGFAKVETKQELHDFLEDYINDQEENIIKTIAKLQSDQGLSIYGFASLLEKSKEQQGIAKDSIFDLIINDKENEESSKHIIEGLLIGVLAIALGLLTFGTGTVAVLLAAGNFALGAYLTYEEIETYRTQLAAYKVNISDDEPSAVWVIIAVVGSVLDAAAVAKISKTLIKAGRSFEETKDITQTKKVLEEAKLDTETEEKVLKALEQEANSGKVEFINGYTKEKILNIPKGERPDPSVYLPKEYIVNHLKEFEEGAVRFTSRTSFQERGTLGPPGAFVLPKKYFDELVVKSKGEVKILEELLGFDEGYLKGDDVMIVFFEKNDIPDLRIPSGNEGGANSKWIPGGYTSGNTPEAVVDLNKKITFKEVKIKFK